MSSPVPVVCIAAVLALAVPRVVAAAPSATLDNLQAAFDGDINAQARYTVFAERAERDGYRQVARLFRAAARSEEIRAGSHARVIRLLGGEPRARIEPPQARTTRENLLWTLAHEGAERSSAYPRYIEQARRDGSADAALGFTLARGAEVELVKLYQEALANLEKMREPGDALYVCVTCGTVWKGSPPERCPVSSSPREAFVRVDDGAAR